MVKIIKQNKKDFWILATICIFLLMCFETGLQLYNHITSNINTTRMLLERVVAIADKNDKADANLEASLKEEYLIRARSIAYLVTEKNESETDLRSLAKIAGMFNVDEIHFFNKEGVIYAGTVPKYYGYSMDDGPQIGFFKPLLNNYHLGLCQNVTPNTAEAKKMMYAMVWKEDHSGLVQVGIEPHRLLHDLKAHNVIELPSSIPVTDSTGIFVTDLRYGTILGASNNDYVLKKLTDLGLDLKSIGFNKPHLVCFDGEYCICDFVDYKQYGLGVVNKVVFFDHALFINLGLLLFYLLIAAMFISKIVEKLNATNLEKLYLSIKSNTDELTGLYNRRSLVEDEMEYNTKGLPQDFLVVSMDIDGLKYINDNFGHVAGDELITGAATCMKQVLAKYGKIYRMGGDEFIALLEVPEEKFKELRIDFHECMEAWQGDLVKSMHISVAYVAHRDYPEATLLELGKIADEKMYEIKREYYRVQGKI